MLKLVRKFTICNFPISTPNGFTLIELLVSLTITLTISAMGVFTYVGYANNQKVQNATSDVVSVLQLARSRAQSQVKVEEAGNLADCSGLQLSSYKVTFTPPKTYKLSVLCGSPTPTEKIVFTKDLIYGNDVSFTAQAFTFDVLSGNVSPAGGTVQVQGFNQTKTVSVSSIGTITVQ